MAMKVPTPEELQALVATTPETPFDSNMQQLLLQVQANAAAGSISAEATPGSTLNVAPNQMGLNVTMDKPVKSDTMELLPMETGHSGLNESSSISGSGSASTPMKRKSIPLSMKKEAIQWIMGPGKGIPSRAEKHFGALNWDVSASSFRKWWKNRDKILGDSGSKKRISGGGRKPYLEDSEEKLLVVVIQERAKKDRVTRKWIAKTAQHMFQRSDSTFKASENWVTKFIRRNGLTLKRSYVTYEPQTPLEQHQQSLTSAPIASSAQAAATDAVAMATPNESVV